MNTLIVYYSLDGNTDCAAHMIAKQLDADLLRIQTVKPYPDSGFGKFFWAGKSAVFHEKPKLTSSQFWGEKYGRIILGFPVWAGNFAPPIRTFVEEHRSLLHAKRVAAFACQGGSGADKAFGKLRHCLRRSLDAELALIDPKDRPSPENAARIAEFCEKLTATERK